MHRFEAGQRALAHIDKALAERPKADGQELSAALRCLAGLRDGLVRSYRHVPDERSRGRLERINAIISSVMGMQFPSGERPWATLIHARAWLADLVEGVRADARDI
jgi:hypothetical protein